MSELVAKNNVEVTLVVDLRRLIDEARRRVATTVNTELTMLYWRVGARIRRDVLNNERAEYGERVVKTLAAQLTTDYGKGFARPNLFRMVRFAEVFPDEQIVSTLSRQLSWSHFLEILPVSDELARTFYAEMCRIERWSVRALRAKIDGLLYERTALSRKPEQVIEGELEALRADDRMTPDLVFRDLYTLDFLGLQDTYSERDLETAILRELESFLLEMGTHFAFVARQKRIVIDGEDFRIDLLLFHRALQRLIAIELKVGRLQAADKGQVELYLRWLDKHERLPHEESPLGLILCTEATPERIALLQLEAGGIRVAEYLTALPPRALLEEKLNRAIDTARARQSSRTERESEGES